MSRIGYRLCLLALLSSVVLGCSRGVGETTAATAVAGAATEVVLGSLEDALEAEPGTQLRLQTGFIGDAEGGQLCDSSAESNPPTCQQTTLTIMGLPIDEFDLWEDKGIASGRVDVIVAVEPAGSEFDVSYVGRP